MGGAHTDDWVRTTVDEHERYATELTGHEEETRLVEALRRGDETAFLTLVERYHAVLVRLALLYVPGHAVAEEVAQETWLAVVRGITRFEGRATLRTWLFRILTNIAKTRGTRERRSIPFSSMWRIEDDSSDPAVDPDRFLTEGPAAGHWKTKPSSWETAPDQLLLSGETHNHIQTAIAALSPQQREVITLRDIEGWTADEVCNALAISETNQRVLLHRARSKVRQALETYLHER